MKQLSACLASLLLAGCAVGPRTVVPTAPVQAQRAFLGAASEGVVEARVPDDWWRLFEDQALDEHVRRALAVNADLRVALGNLEVARAAVRSADAARLPNTVLESGAGPNDASKQPSTAVVPKSSYDLAGTVAYEVDLFGRLRSGSEAARADFEASEAAHDTVRVAVVADTVAAYVDACGAGANARIASEQIAVQQRGLDLVGKQLRAGEVSPYELAQAKLLLERARAALPVFEADRARALFRLATLEGLPPAAAPSLVVRCRSVPLARQPLPIGDGAALLARRPDIREAEHRLAAATARIGVAMAELYPRVQLGGSAGLLSGNFEAFLTPLVSWAFPNQSAARAKIASAKGTQAAALATWDVVILRALREVESALADYRAETARNAALRLAFAEAGKVQTRAAARHRLGADSYLVVVDAQRSRQDVEAQIAASDLRIAQVQVALFRALGGGWAATN